MSDQFTLRTLNFKLYPTAAQIRTFEEWLRTACWVYNQALNHRTKAYKRRKKSISLYDQTALLTQWRKRIQRVRFLPAEFARSALRRVDHGMKEFFRRTSLRKGKAGYPRFRPHQRFNSISYQQAFLFIRDHSIHVPGIGVIRARGRFGISGTQKILRVIRRSSGWYAQVVIEQPAPATLPNTGEECGIDMGLESFLTTDTGEHVGNPRLLRKSAKKLRRAQQHLARCQRGSNRRKVAVKHVALLHEKVSSKRRGFCHRISREMVNRFDRIAVENLNIKGLANGRNAKSVRDAAWGIFLRILRVKAESAGREVVEVDPAYTSQTCPECGRVKKKSLDEREHNCSGCGFRCHRDRAAAMVVRQRAFRPARGESVSPPLVMVAGSAKRKASD